MNKSTLESRSSDIYILFATKVNPDAPARSRIERYKLQHALLGQIPEDFIKLSKKLKTVVESDDGVTITFKDGTAAGPFDLLIGADGIRSVSVAETTACDMLTPNYPRWSANMPTQNIGSLTPAK